MIKSYFTSLAILFAFVAHSQVKVTLLNTTGDRLISVIVNGKPIGTIENNSIKTIEFDTIHGRHGLPSINISAIRRGEKLQAKSFSMICLSGPNKTIIDKEYKKAIALRTDTTGRKDLYLEEMF